MSRLTLRPYQGEAVGAVRTAWAGGMRRPAVVLPTGAGKTVVFAELAEIVVQETGGRVLVVAHRNELIEQAAARLASVSGQRVGVVKAERNETGPRYVVGSVQSLRSPERLAQIRDVRTVIVDECHHATAATYVNLLAHFGCLDGVPVGRTDGIRANAVGFTATMSRGDGAGLGTVWDDVVYERKIAPMIRDGYLVEPRGIRVDVEDLDLDAVRRTSGDWQDGALGEAMSASMAPELIVKAWHEHAAGRPTVLFGPTVAFAEVMVEAFRSSGVTADIVHGGQTREERAAVWRAVDRGDVTVVCNCAVATEGTDVPKWSCAIIARPTGHVGLYVQMVGRILRPYPGKSDALVLDVAGATKRHRLASLVDLIGVDDVATREPSEAEEVDGELEEDHGGLLAPYKHGGVTWEEVDLFHGSRLTWLQTGLGVWFLPAGNRYIAILPSIIGTPGAFDVVSFESWHGGSQHFIEAGVPDLSYAMGFGENVVTDAEAEVAARDARFRNNALTAPERRRAARLGLPGTVRRGQLAEVETRHHATARIDPIAMWARDHARRA